MKKQTYYCVSTFELDMLILYSFRTLKKAKGFIKGNKEKVFDCVKEIDTKSKEVFETVYQRPELKTKTWIF